MQSNTSIPDLMIPFGKEKHVGYTLCCYRNLSAIYSIPMEVSTSKLKDVLGRENIISGEPLTKVQFRDAFEFVACSAELCWHSDFEFLIEGANLPPDWE